MESTVTPLDNNNLLGPVAPATAHNLTSVNPQRSIITQPPMGTLYPQLGVLLAESRRHLVVHQVLHTWRFVFWIKRFELELVFVLFLPILPLGVNTIGHEGVHLGVFWESVGVSFVLIVATVGRGDVRGTVVPVFESVAYGTERWELHPASFDCAGPGHAVAFAFLTHLGPYML